MTNGAPRTHVLRLLLRPDELRDVRITREQLVVGGHRERIDLLQAGNGDPFGLPVGRMPDDVVIDLARAKDEPARAAASFLVELRVVEDLAEAAFDQVVEPRGRLLEAQKALRSQENERTGLGVERLAAKDVEVLGSRRTVDDADVLLRCELHETLEAGARMLGPVALVPMWEQQGQPRALVPLREARDDELVDHHLRRVDEVPELGLPEYEGRRAHDRIPVLEPERTDLGERGVVDLHRRRRGRQVRKRRVDASALVVVQNEVAM